MFDSVPESLDDAQNIANMQKISLNDVIKVGLQNWIEELLAENFEGNYFMAELHEDSLHIVSITGEQVFIDSEISASKYIERFKANPHETILLLQTKIRDLIDNNKLS